MSTDALSAIISFGNNIYSSGLSFLVSWSTFVGVAGFALVLASAHNRGNRGGQVYTGKTLLSLFFCAGLTCLKPLVNASGAQFGFEMTSFDSISWAPTSTFGQGAEAVNALLTVARLFGIGCFMGGLNTLRRSGLEGHTALSASENTSLGFGKIIFGTLLAFIDNVLDATLTSLNIHF